MWKNAEHLILSFAMMDDHYQTFKPYGEMQEKQQIT